MQIPQYELNVSDYLRIVRKRKYVIIAVVLATAVFSSFFFRKQEPIYEARATVKLSERKTIAGLLTEWIAYNPGDVMESETQLIMGFPVLHKVALRLGITSSESPEDKIQSVVAELRSNVKAETVKNTNIIAITATALEPKMAMDLANTVAQVYVSENLIEKNKQARGTRKFIEEQLSGVDAKLKNSEERLRRFSNEVKGIRSSAAIQDKLTSLEFEMQNLLQKYTHKHPLVIQLKTQIGELEQKLKNFSGKELEYSRMLREIEVSKRLYAMLKEKLEEARISEAQRVGDVSILDPAIMPASAVNKGPRGNILLSILLGVVLGFIFAFIIESMDTSIGTIEDVERLTNLPVLGVVPSIGVNPDIDKHSHKGRGFFKKIFSSKQSKQDNPYARLIVHYAPKSPIAEAYRTIRTNLKLSPEIKSLLVASANSGEGKTTTISNLGLAIAQTGAKTLLVSSDLRRPSLAATFGLSEAPGLNEVVTGAVSLDSALRGISDIIMGGIKLKRIMESPGIENITILTSGRLPVNPSELLMSKEMQDIVSEFKKRFDVILYDSPPILPVTDAALLAANVDAAILVYEAGSTARSALLRAKVQLESAKARILGVVLNHTKAETEIADQHSYYYKYEYGKNSPEK